MQLVIVSFSLAESVYSHSLVADGREITLNIWDSPYSEVTDTLSHNRLTVYVRIKESENTKSCSSPLFADLLLIALF